MFYAEKENTVGDPILLGKTNVWQTKDKRKDKSDNFRLNKSMKQQQNVSWR